ncbi:glucose-6-phosphate exchanger SLC37A2 [Ostrinia furnacalis]|uniref:glucose-6-phosphate exchanger SLC37A2 n=1 Tax=Ostrinia furnacalis TaxID=93504 RepID=UPI00103EA52A|nr:glucose-6-phosphate exchanger SLC37A2 [Ostrinia furnacalis]
MSSLLVGFVKHFRRKKRVKMSGVSRDAPLGVQCLQSLSGSLFPRLQFNRLLLYQSCVLMLTFFTYMTYHLTRKPISVVKSVLHRNCSGFVPPPGVDPADDNWCDWPPFNTTDANTLLGALDSAFLFSYAGAMFVSGMVAERVDLRYFLSLGMLLSAACCYMFGVGYTYGVHSIAYYLLAQAGAGIAQTTGWPGTVAIVGKWFGNSKKGLIFGIWNSHTSLGNILGALLAAEYVETNWALSFIYPALVMGVVALFVFLFLPPEPKHVGIVPSSPPSTRDSPSRQSRSDDEEEPEPAQVIVGDQTASLRPNRHSANNPPYSSEDATESTALLSRRPSHSHGSSAVSLSRALSIPGVMEFSLSLFFAKLVSYTFLYWLPMYIKSSTHLTPKQSADLSTVFDVGGIVGAIAAGLLADRSRSPATVCAAFYVLCAPALLVYQRWGATSYGTNVALLIVGGALVNGPYALITTAVSAELGTHSCLAGNAQALATVTAIIDGTGSPSRQSRSDDEEDPEPAQVIVGDQTASLRPNRHSANNPPYSSEDATESTALLSRRPSHSHGSSAVSLSRALSIPGVMEFSLSLFFAKLVSYTFLYWLPMYIKSSTHLTPKQSADLSTVFDVGGIVGAITAGLLADRSRSPATVCAAFYVLCAPAVTRVDSHTHNLTPKQSADLSTVFDVGGIVGAIAAGLLADRSRSPATVCAGFYVLCAPALLVYQRWGATSYATNVALLIVGGALVNGPYALITTAVSAELGTHSCLAGNAQALATVTAIIDGTGSVGAALGPMLAGVVSSTGDWSRVFYMLIACDALALLLLLR